MEARRTAAAAVLADYQRAVQTADLADRALWGARLADMLQYLLAAVNQPPAGAVQGGSWTAPDGSAWLAPGDVATVRQALFHAAAESSPAAAVRYDSLRFRLGDDR